MIIDCISDLHGFYPKLEGGDLLIVAGDLTRTGEMEEYLTFGHWLEAAEYNKKVIIAGNHDTALETDARECYWEWLWKTDAVYLCDSGTEFEGLRIWGSPWTKTFPGMNPHAKAFTVDTEEELWEKFRTMAHNIDVLVTHSPPYGRLDELMEEGKHVGSAALEYAVKRMRPKLHVFGHIHESYGMVRPKLDFVHCLGYPIFVNASHVNERYEPVNKPIRINL